MPHMGGKTGYMFHIGVLMGQEAVRTDKLHKDEPKEQAKRAYIDPPDLPSIFMKVNNGEYQIELFTSGYNYGEAAELFSFAFDQYERRFKNKSGASKNPIAR